RSMSTTILSPRSVPVPRVPPGLAASEKSSRPTLSVSTTRRCGASKTAIVPLVAARLVPVCQSSQYDPPRRGWIRATASHPSTRSEEHTSELQSHRDLPSSPPGPSPDLIGRLVAARLGPVCQSSQYDPPRRGWIRATASHPST